MSLLDVVRYMVLMIVSGRSGSGKSVACVRWKIWFYCVELPVVLLPDLARTLADRDFCRRRVDVRNMRVTRNIRTGDE